jgi:ANTAR domain
VVAEPDLADPVSRRWPAFTRSALKAGVRAVFGFPLRAGTVRLGARAGIDLAEAFARLRAYARDQNLCLTDVAQAAIDGTLDPLACPGPFLTVTVLAAGGFPLDLGLGS